MSAWKEVLGSPTTRIANASTVADALALATQEAPERGGDILITGSVYLVGEALALKQ